MSHPLSDEDIIRRYYRLFNQRRIAEASRLVAPECEFEHVPTREHAQGPRGYVALAEDWLRAVPDATVDVERVDELQPGIYRVVLVGRGTRDGHVELSPQTKVDGDGRPFQFRATQRLCLRDGQIVAARLTYDLSELTGEASRPSAASGVASACPSCGERNVVVAWRRLDERGLFCPVCEHGWDEPQSPVAPG